MVAYNKEKAMHQIERAIFDLRRGLPVVIRDDQDADSGQDVPSETLVYPVESMADSAIEQLTTTREWSASLTLTRYRLQAMGYSIRTEAASLPLRDEARPASGDLYREAASARSARSDLFTEPRPARPCERAALALMRRALLVPAALTATIERHQRDDIDRAVANGELLSVPARAAERCLDLGAGLLKRVSEANVPLADGVASRFVLFREPDGLREHVAVLIGDRAGWDPDVPVRLHSACLTGDLFGSLRCDCGEQLRTGVKRIDDLGGGVLLYLDQEGRGIGLANKLRAYALQDEGRDTVEADHILGFGDDERRYAVAVDMLMALSIRRVHLLTNNPDKIAALAAGGIDVALQDRLYGSVTDQNRGYLKAKASHSGHLLDALLKES